MEIARGIQYKVFDTYDGRVRKIPLTTDEAIAVLESWNAQHTASQEELEGIASHKEDAIRSCRRVAQILEEHPELSPLLGNPKFEKDGIYTQDRLTILGKMLEHASFNESTKILNAYIESITRCWQYGFSERVFNFSVNNGIDASGHIVLLDFGEITFSKREVLSTIASKWWLRAFSYANTLSVDLQEYYRQVMENQISLDTLERMWKILL